MQVLGGPYDGVELPLSGLQICIPTPSGRHYAAYNYDGEVKKYRFVKLLRSEDVSDSNKEYAKAEHVKAAVAELKMAPTIPE